MGEKSKNDILKLRRSQLTRAAYQVVGKKGYYNFTIKDLAKEAGLSTGLVHYYFKNKQDLLFNLLKEMNKNIKVYLNKSISESDDPIEKLRIFIKQAFDLVSNEKDYFHVLFDFWTQINKNEKIKNANIKLFQSYREECANIITEGMEKNVFKEFDVKYATTIIISIIQGMIIQYVIDNDAFDYTEYTEKIMNQIIEFLVNK